MRKLLTATAVTTAIATAPFAVFAAGGDTSNADLNVNASVINSIKIEEGSPMSFTVVPGEAAAASGVMNVFGEPGKTAVVTFADNVTLTNNNNETMVVSISKGSDSTTNDWGTPSHDAPNKLYTVSNDQGSLDGTTALPLNIDGAIAGTETTGKNNENGAFSGTVAFTATYQ